ncbi:MAG: hypothetical protein LBO66_08930 [Deltaproteobacteria bacterium]|jgi:hypothetical protein|nr:hypothetical protein [Deltaproteobacteria bacterium]
MNQIEKKKYDKKFQGGGGKIYKTALVIGGRVDNVIIFEEADNWLLEMDPDGTLTVRQPPTVKITRKIKKLFRRDPLEKLLDADKP